MNTNTDSGCNTDSTILYWESARSKPSQNKKQASRQGKLLLKVQTKPWAHVSFNFKVSLHGIQCRTCKYSYKCKCLGVEKDSLILMTGTDTIECATPPYLGVTNASKLTHLPVLTGTICMLIGRINTSVGNVIMNFHFSVELRITGECTWIKHSSNVLQEGAKARSNTLKTYIVI